MVKDPRTKAISISGLAKIIKPTVAGTVRKSTVFIEAFITFLPSRIFPEPRVLVKIGKTVAVIAVMKIPIIIVFILFA